MRKLIIPVLAALFLPGCGSGEKGVSYGLQDGEFVLAFGSCNKQNEINALWDDVLEVKPAVWVWAGDNIYADTDDKRQKRRAYEEQRYQNGYRELKKEVRVTGTWDDHDYGQNDGGADYAYKEDAQELFLDFMEVPKNHPRRIREGVYHSEEFQTPEGKVKLIMLDTRYFRSPLTRNFGDNGKKYLADKSPESTMLGADQWKWLETQLYRSDAQFNIIVSSVQVISGHHGFESWGNFPVERERLYALIRDSKANGVVVVSGDRHFSEFSQINVEGLRYPLIDFTSSGLTHSWEDASPEENPNRVGDRITDKSFGVLRFNMRSRRVSMQMIGDGGEVLQELAQGY